MIAVLTILRDHWRLLAIGAAIAALLGALWAFGAHERHVQYLQDEAALAQAQAEALTRNEAAKAVAERQRAVDLAATATLERKLTDAYAKTSDSRPSAARIALACQRLRNQAGPGGKLPVACGSGG